MKRPASLVAAILLMVIAFAQLMRFVAAVPIVAAGITIPVWISAVVAIVLGLLGFWLLHERKQS
jgi:hypothetical protein